MRSDSGYIGSFLVHLGVIGVVILFARLQPTPAREVEDQDPLLLEVWQGDGSERDPGIPGAARGIAEGASTGDKSKMGLGAKPFTRVRVLDSGKLLREMKEAEARAAAEAKEEAKAAAEAKSESTKATKTTPDEKSSKTSDKVSFADFKKANAKAGKSSSSGATSVAKSSGGASGHAGISGVSVGGGTGRGTGEGGFGRPNGTGRNGGDGGSGNAEKLFVGDVKGKFADVFIPLFREQGGELSSDKDSGTVKVLVSPSGLVSFAGWFHRPSDPLVERLVIESIRKMRPVRPPPGGDEIIVRIPVSGSVEE